MFARMAASRPGGYRAGGPVALRAGIERIELKGSMAGAGQHGSGAGRSSAARAGRPLPVGGWVVDPQRSAVGFTVRHLLVTTVRGAFRHFEASLETDGSGLRRAVGSVDAASVDTGDPKRDASLLAPGFLDADRYPNIAFSSREIDHADGSLEVLADLTLKGVTRPIRLAGTIVGEANGSGEIARARIVTQGAISRAEFGVTGGGVLESAGAVVSDVVNVLLEIRAVRLPESGR